MTEPERQIARQLIDQARRAIAQPECPTCGDQGSASRYSHGCRQPLCRQAHAAYKQATRPSRARAATG